MTKSESVTPPAAAVGAPARPRSAAGAHLKAIATNRKAARDFRLDDSARLFFYCAFKLAARRRFRSDSPIAEIARSVAAAARRHAPIVVPAIEAEMLIRDALGEAVPIAEISLDTVLTTHLLVFASLVDELALSDDEVDAMIAGAEERVAALAVS